MCKSHTRGWTRALLSIIDFALPADFHTWEPVIQLTQQQQMSAKQLQESQAREAAWERKFHQQQEEAAEADVDKESTNRDHEVRRDRSPHSVEL